MQPFSSFVRTPTLFTTWCAILGAPLAAMHEKHVSIHSYTHEIPQCIDIITTHNALWVLQGNGEFGTIHTISDTGCVCVFFLSLLIISTYHA